MSRQSILNEILEERRLRDVIEGPDVEDVYSITAWARLIEGAARHSIGQGSREPDVFRRKMILCAATAMAAVEAHDRRYPAEKVGGAVHTGSGF